MWRDGGWPSDVFAADAGDGGRRMKLYDLEELRQQERRDRAIECLAAIAGLVGSFLLASKGKHAAWGWVGLPGQQLRLARLRLDTSPLVPAAAAGRLHGQQPLGDLDVVARMSMPSKFEVMRRNRPKVARARTTILEKIAQVEAEVTAQWEVDHSEQLREIAEAIAHDRERQLRRVSWLRRALNWSMGFGAAA
jgi:hypothetical protein